ncbi:hypothetical protein CQ14_21285 [Bradyrhizobium lablabi]|uniref:Uncharacterized protein n=1 Tax=Bradyrhizobium lablabi TaxID=722472 RepID=A0A0R3N1H8_9BRAD|nr:hypothetical protein CQ14_21285 [Bradyrhizobium lablabi]
MGLVVGQPTIAASTKQSLGHLVQERDLMAFGNATEKRGRDAFFQAMVIVSRDHGRSPGKLEYI